MTAEISNMDCVLSDTPASALHFRSVRTVLRLYRRMPSYEQGDTAEIFRGEGSQSLEIILRWFKNRIDTEKLSKCGKMFKSGKPK